MFQLSKWLVLAALITFGKTIFAGDSSSGCGLGWQVFKKKSLVSSSLRATTNTIFLNTIAMTVGTSGCAKHSIVKNDKKSLHYLENNLPSVQIEMAMGSGEYLNGLAQTFGCEQSIFADKMQQNYGVIFDKSDRDAMDVLLNIETQIIAQPAMLKACGLI